MGFPEPAQLSRRTGVNNPGPCASALTPLKPPFGARFKPKQTAAYRPRPWRFCSVVGLLKVSHRLRGPTPALRPAPNSARLLPRAKVSWCVCVFDSRKVCYSHTRRLCEGPDDRSASACKRVGLYCWLGRALRVRVSVVRIRRAAFSQEAG